MNPQLHPENPVTQPFLKPDPMLDFAPDLSQAIEIANSSMSEPDAYGLTKWEKIILTRMSEDADVEQIGAELSLSDYSIQGIANAAAKKMDCTSIIAAVAKAIRNRII